MTQATAPEETTPTASAGRFSQGWKPWAPVVFLLVLIGGFSLLEPTYFPTLDNAKTVLNDGAVLAILTCGLTLVLIVGEFDLSVAAVASFAGALATVMVTQLGSPPLAVLILTLGMGGVTGILNGLLVVRLEIPALVATIGTASVLDGLSLWITGNSVIFDGITDAFMRFGGWRWMGFQGPLVYLVCIAVGLGLFLKFSVTGRHLYATGGNRAASRMSGVRVERQVITAFACCSTLAAFAGYIYTSRQGSLTPLFATPFLLPCFAAAFLGYVTLANRRFHILGSVIGVYIITVGTFGLLLIGAPAYSQQLFAGSVLLLATGGSRLLELSRNRKT